jgi:hypothetical protein
MVGQSTARKNARNTQELEEMFNKRLLEAKQRKIDLARKMSELEKDFAAADAEENTWDAALFELQNVGVPSGPKSRRKPKEGEEIEEDEEDEERD